MNELTEILELPAISRIRRNHGLEHATLHVLSSRFPRRAMAGHSDVGGFWLIGDLTTEEIQSAVELALTRLRNGEHELAIHPNCGTNLATAGVLAGGAAWLALLGTRRIKDQWERLPMAMAMAMLGVLVSQPLGLRLQAQVTTSGNPGNLEVIEIYRAQQGKLPAHRVVTQG